MRVTARTRDDFEEPHGRISMQLQVPCELGNAQTSAAVRRAPSVRWISMNAAALVQLI